MFFVDRLSSARFEALRDAEQFDGIIHAIEALGYFLTKSALSDQGAPGSLDKFGPEIKAFVKVALDASDDQQVIVGFDRLYEAVRIARNDAVHKGAFARHLTSNAIKLAITLERALRMQLPQTVSVRMTRDPVCASLWQPLDFVRQAMLENSYSYLPVCDAEGTWRVIVDAKLVAYLSGHPEGILRRKKLSETVQSALANVSFVAKWLGEASPVEGAATAMLTAEHPVLLVEKEENERNLVGILTAFDLL